MDQQVQLMLYLQIHGPMSPSLMITQLTQLNFTLMVLWMPLALVSVKI